MHCQIIDFFSCLIPIVCVEIDQGAHHEVICVLSLFFRYICTGHPLGASQLNFLLSIVHEELDRWYSQTHFWRQVISPPPCRGLPCMSLMMLRCLFKLARSYINFCCLTLHYLSLIYHFHKKFLSKFLTVHVICSEETYFKGSNQSFPMQTNFSSLISEVSAAQYRDFRYSSFILSLDGWDNTINAFIMLYGTKMHLMLTLWGQRYP